MNRNSNPKLNVLRLKVKDRHTNTRIHMFYKSKHNSLLVTFFPLGATAASRSGFPHYQVFTITFRRTTLGRTLLDEWSAPSRNLCLTTLNHKRQTSISSVGFEPSLPTSELPQTHPFDCTANGNRHTSDMQKIRESKSKLQIQVGTYVFW
jgi:hypothetical protein